MSRLSGDFNDSSLHFIVVVPQHRCSSSQFLTDSDLLTSHRWSRRRCVPAINFDLFNFQKNELKHSRRKTRVACNEFIMFTFMFRESSRCSISYWTCNRYVFNETMNFSNFMSRSLFHSPHGHCAHNTTAHSDWYGTYISVRYRSNKNREWIESEDMLWDWKICYRLIDLVPANTL